MIKLERSGLLPVWWAALHALVALAGLAAAPNWAFGAVVLAVLALHYRFRRPRSCPMLLIAGDGRFSLPSEARFGLRLGPATCLSTFWADLELEGRPGRLLLLRDQFTDSDWRRLIVALRESG